MNSSLVAVFLFALLVASARHTTAQRDGINPLLPFCKTVGGGSTYFGIDFCISALDSDKRSRDAEGYRNLSLIAIDLLAANATSTRAKVGGLLEKAKGDAAMAEPLLSCQAMYGGMVGLLPGCTAAIKAGMFDHAALNLEEGPATGAKDCEEEFRKHNLASPLTVENDSAFKLAKLAVALLGFAS